MALKQLFMFTRQQGIVMAFADVFLLLCLYVPGICGAGVAHAPPAVIGAGARPTE